MARHWFVSAALCACLTLNACGANTSELSPTLHTGTPTSASQTSEEDQMPRKSTPGASQTAASSPTDRAQPPTLVATSATRLSQPEIEALVTADLATRLNQPARHIQIISTVARTWNDQGLGCARKGMYEPTPTPGYELTLAYGGQTFRYHTDLQGRLVRCIEGSKPLGAINR